MAPRLIRTHELVELAAEHSALDLPEADDAVRAVVDTISELGDEIQVVDDVTEPDSGEGVIVQRAALDPANPPKLDVESAAIADQGMIAIDLFRSR